MQLLLKVGLSLLTGVIVNVGFEMMIYFWKVNMVLLQNHNHGHAALAKLDAILTGLLYLLAVFTIQNYLGPAWGWLVLIVITTLLTQAPIVKWLKPKQLRWLKRL